MNYLPQSFLVILTVGRDSFSRGVKHPHSHEQKAINVNKELPWLALPFQTPILPRLEFKWLHLHHVAGPITRIQPLSGVIFTKVDTSSDRVNRRTASLE